MPPRRNALVVGTHTSALKSCENYMARAAPTDFTVSLEEGEELYSGAATAAIERIEALGLEIPGRPVGNDGKPFDGHLPPNVSNFTTRELADIYTLMCNYADYLENLCTVARAEVLNTDKRLKLTKALVRKSKAGTAQERDDLCLCDSRYIMADVAYVEACTYAELLEGLSKAASRDRQVLSRLIETKKMELENKRRDGNARSYRP
jgi:hypothetical protein